MIFMNHGIHTKLRHWPTLVKAEAGEGHVGVGFLSRASAVTPGPCQRPLHCALLFSLLLWADSVSTLIFHHFSALYVLHHFVWKLFSSSNLPMERAL